MDDLERALSKERLADVAGTLADLQNAFTNAQMADEDQQRKSTLAGLLFVQAGFLALELAMHLRDGKEFHEAIRATARGDLSANRLDPTHELRDALSRLNDPMRLD